MPAKWVVYLMADEADRPVQLLCVRTFTTASSGPGRRRDDRAVETRELPGNRSTHLLLRRVDSAEFEADSLYYEAARELFPQTYQGMVGFRPAWFVHIDPEANFPRYTKTTEIMQRTGNLYGPVEDKHAGAKLVQLVEDGSICAATGTSWSSRRMRSRACRTRKWASIRRRVTARCR